MRQLWGGWSSTGLNLLTAPGGASRPDQWPDGALASVRGELNYHVLDANITKQALEAATALRDEIESEMRKRLRSSKPDLEFRRRCLFQESEPAYVKE